MTRTRPVVLQLAGVVRTFHESARTYGDLRALLARFGLRARRVEQYGPNRVAVEVYDVPDTDFFFLFRPLPDDRNIEPADAATVAAVFDSTGLMREREVVDWLYGREPAAVA